MDISCPKLSPQANFSVSFFEQELVREGEDCNSENWDAQNLQLGLSFSRTCKLKPKPSTQLCKSYVEEIKNLKYLNDTEVWRTRSEDSQKMKLESSNSALNFASLGGKDNDSSCSFARGVHIYFIFAAAEEKLMRNYKLFGVVAVADNQKVDVSSQEASFSVSGEYLYLEPPRQADPGPQIIPTHIAAILERVFRY